MCGQKAGPRSLVGWVWFEEVVSGRVIREAVNGAPEVADFEMLIGSCSACSILQQSDPDQVGHARMRARRSGEVVVMVMMVLKRLVVCPQILPLPQAWALPPPNGQGYAAAIASQRMEFSKAVLNHRRFEEISCIPGADEQTPQQLAALEASSTITGTD
jgi:hypothetical protein